MKRLIPLSIVILLIWSCEKLAEEETPLCKDCYKVRYDSTETIPIDTLEYNRLCGGDVPNFQTLGDIQEDSTVIKHFCK